VVQSGGSWSDAQALLADALALDEATVDVGRTTAEEEDGSTTVDVALLSDRSQDGAVALVDTLEDVVSFQRAEAVPFQRAPTAVPFHWAVSLAATGYAVEGVAAAAEAEER
jgi:hypothetical protein